MRKKRNRYRPDLEKRRRRVKYWIKTTIGFVLSLAIVILYSAALAHSYHALLDAPWFRISDVAIKGLKHLKEDEILNTLMIPPESSLLTIKSSQLAKRLETLPWLESSAVRLSFPNRVEVEVIEREPLAVIHSEDYYLIDTGGKLVSRASSEKKQGFILVEGFSGLGLKEGDSLPPDVLQGLKALLAAMDECRTWLSPDSILLSRWNAETGFALYTAQNNTCIQIGWDDFGKKLSRLHRVFEVLTERSLWNSVTGIDLDYKDRVFVEGLFPFPKGG
ncbi:MAG TPA: FtsQ-type POTRA domain-containing protein [Syntrophobacteraceae bacterium]|nr:FtsQ-type POTRA domain-containing protein [Syntrophobacteraceae bacterium]